MDLNELFKGTFIEELATVAPQTPRNHKAQDGEEVIGMMTDLEKRLLALRQEASKAVEAYKFKIQFDAESEDEVDALASRAALAETKNQALNTLLWALMRNRLGNLGKAMGIRSGGEIVLSPEEEAPVGLKGGVFEITSKEQAEKLLEMLQTKLGQ